MFDTRQISLDKLNSLTKYPSIETYHRLGERGRLTETVQVSFPPDASLIGTEKIDGTNSRIIVLPDGLFIIGSREELLYAKGDLIENAQLGIVKALKLLAQRIPPFGACVAVFYLETYGWKTTAAAKQYTSSQQVGFRLFDAVILNEDDHTRWLCHESADKIAAWRDGGGQPFSCEEALHDFAKNFDILLTPRIPIDPPPAGVAETHEWLKRTIQKSQATLDNDAPGRPEGIVVRTADRKHIAKIRFEDYERTARGK